MVTGLDGENSSRLLLAYQDINTTVCDLTCRNGYHWAKGGAIGTEFCQWEITLVKFHECVGIDIFLLQPKGDLE